MSVSGGEIPKLEVHTQVPGTIPVGVVMGSVGAGVGAGVGADVVGWLTGLGCESPWGLGRRNTHHIKRQPTPVKSSFCGMGRDRLMACLLLAFDLFQADQF